MPVQYRSLPSDGAKAAAAHTAGRCGRYRGRAAVDSRLPDTWTAVESAAMPSTEPTRDADEPGIAKVEAWTATPLTLLALLVIPSLLLEQSEDPIWLATGRWLNWIIWCAFAVELATLLVVARDRGAVLRRRWLDAAIVLLTPPFIGTDTTQGFRTLRVLRGLRSLRGVLVLWLALRHLRSSLARRRFHYVLTVAIAILAVGATMIYLFERGSNPSIDSPGDAVWWAIVTATTVGYGDISPTTWGGRAVAVVLMFVGIGVIGLFTGNVAGFFIEQEANPPSDVEARLARIEAQLALLIERHGTTAAAVDVAAGSAPNTPGGHTEPDGSA